MPRLQLDHKIGQGAYGKVYSGVFETIAEPIAVKVLTIEHSNFDVDLCPAIRDLLLGSVSPLRRGVIQFTSDTCHQFGIVTDLGTCTLHALGLNIPLHALRIIGKKILTQIAEIHAKGIMHRDIKPENVVLTFIDGDFPDVNIIDFGLSSLQSSSKDKDICSLWWRAPEVLLRLQHSKNSDIWSFGAMLANMACNTMITSAKTDVEALKDIWNKLGKPDNWTEMDEGLKCFSKELREWKGSPTGITLKVSHTAILPVLALCLQQNPDKRASASVILQNNFWDETPSAMESASALTWFNLLRSTKSKTLSKVSRSFERSEISGECFQTCISGLPCPVLISAYEQELLKYNVFYKEEALGMLQSTYTSWTLGVALHVASALFISGCMLHDYPLYFEELKQKSGAQRHEIFQSIVRLMELLSFQLPDLKKRVIHKK